MPTEMGSEAVEIVTMAMDKFQSNKNYEVSFFLVPSIIDWPISPKTSKLIRTSFNATSIYYLF